MKHSLPTSQDKPTARCKVAAPLLPVLDVPGTDDKAMEEARAHLAGCSYCQAEYAAYRQIDAALERHLSPPAMPRFQTGEIVQDFFASLHISEEARLQQQAAEEEKAVPLPIPRRETPRHPGGRRRFAAGLASLAALLVIALISGAIFRYAGWGIGTTSPGPGTPYDAKTLYDVAMVSPEEGWAVGQSFTFTVTKEHPEGVNERGNVLILHYLHGSWSAVDVPVEGTLTSISMVSAADGWAVGYYSGGQQQTPLLLHYDGRRWQQVTIAAQTGQPWQVQMLSATDGWMAGQHFTQAGQALSSVWHYDGQTWTPQALPATLNRYLGVDSQMVSNLSMLSATDGWALGTRTFYLSGRSTVLLHYTGGQWNVDRVFSNVSGSSLSMLSATDGWMTGQNVQPDTTTPGGTATPLLLHYSGGQWKDVTSSVKDASKIEGLGAVSMRAADDGWMIVIDHDHEDFPSLFHFDGTQWTNAHLPTPPNTSAGGIGRVTMLSAAEGWAVGDHELVTHPGYVSLTRPVIFHYLNGTWKLVKQ